jgi:RNA polymerase sigma factor (sigma-70 family)
MNRTDSQLLWDYSEQHSDAAFSELVRRHVDLVYSAALRMVRDTHLAEDVTQGAFVALSKNAAQLQTEVVLSAWLHRTAQNIAAQTVRTEVRRRLREQEAVAMHDKFAGDGVGEALWQDVEPHLDAALGELNEGDRGAVMLRYFEGKSAREMSAILGISDEASQKRLERAVERLRAFMAKRGVAVGAGGIAGLLSANAVQAAPVALAGIISTTIALNGASMAAATVTTSGSMKFMTTSLVKSILVALAAVTASVTIITQHQKSVSMAEELGQLRARIQKSESAYAEMVEQSKTKQQQVAQPGTNQNELLQLRNEVGRLRAAANAQEQAMDSLKARQAASATGGATESQQALQLLAIGNCYNRMRQIDGAIQQWALENKKGTNAVVVFTEISRFLVKPSMTCPSGGQYIIGKVAEPPSCSFHGKMEEMAKIAFPQQ